MKKEYINPTINVYELRMNNNLLTGSPLPKSTDEVTNENDVLAPGLILGDF